MNNMIKNNQILNPVYCVVCKTQTELYCERCKQVFYCSPLHQEMDWPYHRNTCKKVNLEVNVEDIKVTDREGNSQMPVEDRSLRITPEPSPHSKKELDSNNKHDLEILEDAQNQMLRERARAKNNAIRSDNVKKMIDNRTVERQATLLYYFKKNSQSAIIACKRVILLSRRIYAQFQTFMIHDFFQRYLIRTNKLLQQIEIIADIAILAKIYMTLEKYEQVKQLLSPNNFNTPKLRQSPYPQKKDLNRQQLIEYNLYKEEVAKITALLNTLIVITSRLPIPDTTNRLFTIYRDIAQNHMSLLEVATIELQWGLFFQQANLMSKALPHLEQCLLIRQRYGQSIALADVLYNIGLVQFYLSDKDRSQAINYVKRALQIKKDRLDGIHMQFVPILQTLGKFYIVQEDFKSAFDTFEMALLICRKLLESNNKTRKRIQVLIIFLYRTILKYMDKYPSSISFNSALVSSIQKKMSGLPQFENYQLNQQKKLEEHLVLQIPKELYDIFNSEETEKITLIVEQLTQLSFKNGLDLLTKSQFYNGLTIEKKNTFLSYNPKVDKQYQVS